VESFGIFFGPGPPGKAMKYALTWLKMVYPHQKYGETLGNMMMNIYQDALERRVGSLLFVNL